MTDIEFCEPPPTHINSGPTNRMVDRLQPLKDHPGEWARIMGPGSISTATTKALLLRKGRYSGIADDEFEAVSRVIDGKGYVWARYVGNGSAS